MSGAPVRALVVDDERPARTLLADLLAAEPGVEVVGQAASGTEAVERILALAPDLVFLDVQMPGLDGFGVVRSVGVDRMPAVVFVTAHDRYALDAFDADALDYLLKPFDEARLRRALARARERFERTSAALLHARTAALLARLESRERWLERIVVREGERAYFVPVAQVAWMEASGKHVVLHTSGGTHLVRQTLSEIESQMDPAAFVRIHRSTLVQLAHVREVQRWFKGDHLVILQDGTRLPTGPSYRDRIRSLLGRGG